MNSIRPQLEIGNRINSNRFFSYFFLCLFFISSNAQAVRGSRIVVTDQDEFISITKTLGKREIACRKNIYGRLTPGILRQRGENTLWLSLRRRLRRFRSNHSLTLDGRSKYRILKLKMREFRRDCRKAQEGGNSTPSPSPTAHPTNSPKPSPTGSPTGSPTVRPTASPTVTPTYSPTSTPTASPSASPTGSPTVWPTSTPTSSPTNTPTSTPTSTPTPTATPTSTPTSTPTATPTGGPYRLSISATNGSVTVTPNKAQYQQGEVVEIIPRPDTGYYFAGWSGQAQGKKLVLNLTMDNHKAITANFNFWKAPIGIPAPSFGISDTHYMYVGQTYDYGSGPQPYKDAGNGPYTHYIDNTHPSATDSGNPYGTASVPRMTIPTTFPAGSVVEIHGGPYTYGTYIWRMQSQGTAAKPVFVRGWDANSNNFPIIQGKDIRHSGSYMILENLDLLDTMIIFYPGDSVYDHMVIRNNEIRDNTAQTGSLIAIGDFRQVNPTNTDTVIYNNHIYNNGLPRDQYDAHGIAIMDYSTNVWIVDNHIHDNDGDSIQVNAAGGRAAVSGEHPQYIYIGRNIMHHDTENAVDLKDSEHVIVSENTMYGYRALFDSDGTALLPGNEGGRLTWVLFNDIYDSNNAIRIDDEVLSNTTYIIGNTLHDTLSNGIVTWRKMTLHVINNVFYNIGGGGFVSWVSQHAVVGSTQDSSYSFFNNIFSEVNGYAIEISNWGPMSALADRTPIANNLFYDSTGQVSIKWADSTYSSISSFVRGEPGKCNGCIEADPEFKGASKSDFRLLQTSPAVDAGISSGFVQQVCDTFQTLYGIDIKKDMEGVSRPQGAEWDIGAYEYQ